MDSIVEMLERLQDLSAEELESLESSILTEFDTVESADLTRENIDRMNQLADAADSLRGERTRRETEAAELSAAREDAISRVRGAEDAAEETVEDEAPAAEEAEAEAEAPAEEEKPEPVAAAVETEPVAELATAEPVVKSEDDARVAEVGDKKTPDESAQPETVDANESVKEQEVTTDPAAGIETEKDSEEEETVTAAAREPGALEVPVEHQPVVRAVAPVSITAGADIQGITAGSSLPNMRAVAEAIVRRQHAMGRTSGGDGEQHTIATITASFPEDRILRANEKGENEKKIADITSLPAVTAAGGLCAPVDISYDIFTLDGSTSRPVRDALAVFNADRGGIRFLTPPVLSDLDGSVSVWTLQDDIDAATPGAPDPVKPCLRVDCGQEIVVYTDAIPLCLTFGNLGARAWPELVERHMELAMVWHARFAEQRLITRIGAMSKSVSAAAQLGAARDFFNQLDVAAAAYRNRHRMDSTTPLRVILPEWFRNALRSDMVKQLPGDGQDATFGLADNFMNNWFSVRHINVSWHIDGEAGQLFTEQAAGAALQGFPQNLVWYLFSEGTFLFLDGGTLDLGLVRDSILNGTNDYKVFLETFEGVAKIGVESLRITSQLRIAGASASTVNTI